MAFDSTERPTLVLNPADDEDFRAAAEALLDCGILHSVLLQECLRERYPRTVVRPRELAGENTEIWYVYRDGRWVRSGRRGKSPPSTFHPGGGTPP